MHPLVLILLYILSTRSTRVKERETFQWKWKKKQSDTCKNADAGLTEKSPWAVLGVEPTASKMEIKRAYRRLIHQHHPDKGGDARKCAEITEAYREVVGLTDS